MRQNTLAFFSDVHGNLEALKAVLQDISQRSIPLSNVYCLGDLVGYGPRPNEVVELIKEHSIVSVLGNSDIKISSYLPSHDDYINFTNRKDPKLNSLFWSAKSIAEDNKRWLREREEKVVLKVQNVEILLNHASPLSISDYVYEEDEEKQMGISSIVNEDVIVFGHTHYSYAKWVANKLFINTGSVGKPKDGDCRACYSIVEINNKIEVDFIRVPYDIEKVIKEIEATELMDNFAKLLRDGK